MAVATEYIIRYKDGEYIGINEDAEFGLYPDPNVAVLFAIKAYAISTIKSFDDSDDYEVIEVFRPVLTIADYRKYKIYLATNTENE
jgi:hypothetical protein